MKKNPEKSFQKVTPASIARQNRGQLLVEYVLLIFVVVVIASLLTKSLVGRGEGATGLIIDKWSQMIEMVGADLGD